MDLLKKIRSLDFRTILVFLFLVIILLFISASGISKLFTDYLWFGSLGLSSVWTSIFWTKIFLTLFFVLLAGSFVWFNLFLVDKYSSDTIIFNSDDYLTKRYSELVVPRKKWFRLSIAAIIGLIFGSNASYQWQNWLLFINSDKWGKTDPVFGIDISFYVFRLPFLSFLVSWFLIILIVVFLLVLVTYYLNGSFNTSLDSLNFGFVPKSIKFHISIILALLFVFKGVDYFLARFELLNSNSYGFKGLMSTDNAINLPGLNLLILLSALVVVLLLVSTRRDSWLLAGIGLIIWGASHVIILNISPAIYQRLRVDPVRSVKEASFVEQNMSFTRYAYGLDKLTRTTFNYESGLDSENAKKAADTFSKVPIVDPHRADDEFQNNQTVRGFFSFRDPLDVDRYLIDGESKPVVIAARDLDIGLVDDTWEDRHVLNTHGYGVVIAESSEQADKVQINGGEATHPLDYKISGLGVEETKVDKDFNENYSKAPQIYYSDSLDNYAVVGATRDEIDYQTKTNQSVETRYSGSGGVRLDSLFRRLAFSVRFAQIDPLISGSITDDSKILMNRNVYSRVKEVAPFLSLDSDPYPVVDEGKVYWIVDAYTTTDQFPYANDAKTTLASGDLQSGYNYVRNSVKVVVDAYNGDMNFYIFDDEDPVLKVWARAFPDLFKDKSSMSESLQEHVRYPRDMFTAQSDMWTRYVIDDPKVFIQGDTAWSIANEPSNSAVGEEQVGDNNAAMNANYTFNVVPNENSNNFKPEYVIQRAFAPKNEDSADRAKHLTAVLMARCDGENYGELVLVDIPSGEVQTPDIVDTEIRKLASLTEYKKQRQGNRIDFGVMNMVFVGNNLVYVRPVYAESGGTGNIPELVRVVSSTGDTKRSMGVSLDESINGLVGSDIFDNAIKNNEDDKSKEGDSESQPSADTKLDIPEISSVAQAFELADSLLIEAQQLEAAGDDQKAKELRDQASEVLKRGRKLLGG